MIIDMSSATPVACKPYRYDRAKQKVFDYHIGKMLFNDIIMLIESPFASPVVLCKKDNGRSGDVSETWR